MIQQPDELAAIDRKFKREWLDGRSYQDAMRVYVALWCEAKALNPAFPGDWREDIEPHIALARCLNDIRA